MTVVMRTAWMLKSSSSSSSHHGCWSVGRVEEHERRWKLVAKFPSTALSAPYGPSVELCVTVFLFSARFFHTPPAMAA